MEVLQYHFTGWPDHGAPDAGCEYPALDFILKSAAANQDGAGPIIVHCRWVSAKKHLQRLLLSQCNNRLLLVGFVSMLVVCRWYIGLHRIVNHIGLQFPPQIVAFLSNMSSGSAKT